MQECPNCGEKSIKDWDKFMSGPARMIICKNCNAKVSISWITFIFVIAIFASFNLLRPYLEDVLYYVSFALLLGTYTVIAWRFIPLRFRGFKE